MQVPLSFSGLGKLSVNNSLNSFLPFGTSWMMNTGLQAFLQDSKYKSGEITSSYANSFGFLKDFQYYFLKQIN